MTFRPGQLESVLRQVETLPDATTRESAREIARLVLDFHRRGFARIVELIRDAGEPGAAILEKASRDEMLRNLFVLHDLEPPPPDRDFVPLHRLTERHGLASSERCELCGEPVGEPHPHLLALETRRLTCACDSCALLFDGNATHRYRRVRPKARALPGLLLDDDAWRALAVPVGLAFFSRASADDAVLAAYPGPAGAVETQVDPAAWSRIVDDNPALRDLAPDVEALLVNRMGCPPEYWHVSLDHCFKLTGLVRSRWRGISGGDGIAGEVGRFFKSLREAVS
jgi:hypothetical protein